ncbi:MAG: MlaC/ttg2D family ABC transporter substrate-binding protein [Syntrophobacteraceae bacterium]
MLLDSKNNRFFTGLLVLWVLFVFPRVTRAEGASPMGVIKSGTDKVLSILRESRSGQGLPLRQRENEILNVVSTYFDFELMAKRSMGTTWNQLSAGNRQEFAYLFKKLLFNTYLDRMAHYHNEPITYDSQQVNGDLAVVKSHFLTEGGKIPIDYKMYKEGGHWKVYDVVVQGVSYDDNYRAQIASILASQSFDSLLTMLRQKIERPG